MIKEFNYQNIIQKHFQNFFKKNKDQINFETPNKDRKVVIYTTCFVNFNKKNTGVAALKVLKDDFAANGGEWLDMPVTGGGGDAANVALKARIVAGDPPSASQIKGPTIQEYDPRRCSGSLQY